MLLIDRNVQLLLPNYKSTHAQKSSTVSNSATSFKQSSQFLFFSDLQYHKTHVYINGCLTKNSLGGKGATATLSASLSTTTAWFGSFSLSGSLSVFPGDKESMALSSLNCCFDSFSIGES
uniref:Uncharacterized protein n=1 Tax=Romanomermis culicivorax TaxID=13658 RepID=A0A915JYT7_ROMCU